MPSSQFCTTFIGHPTALINTVGHVVLSGGNDGSATNLQACVGECDADSQCAAGLKCFQRSNGEKIPGCVGPGSDKGHDYCYDPGTVRV